MKLSEGIRTAEFSDGVVSGMAPGGMVVAMVAGPGVREAADDGLECCPALLEGAVLVDGPARLCEAVEGGQVIVLTRNGRATAVVLDLDTYAEWAEVVRVATGSP